MIHVNRLLVSIGLLGVLMLVGCGGGGLSAVRGKAVLGPTPAIMWVNKNDPRLQEPGLGDVTVELTLDPQRLSRKTKPAVLTQPDGTFAISVPELAGGLQMYDVGVVAQTRGYGAAQAVLGPPRLGQRLLVVLSGRGVVRPREDLLQETVEQGTRLQNAME